jgi:hypothetical protein
MVIVCFLLIGLGVWGYFDGIMPTPTSIVPAIFAVVFLITTPLLKKEICSAVLLVSVLAWLLSFAVIGYIVSSVGEQNWIGLGRNIAMLLLCIAIIWVLWKPFLAFAKNIKMPFRKKMEREQAE